ncbi:MAG: hypothetical protein ACOYOV_05820 [Bacteroidales bacterium]
MKIFITNKPLYKLFVAGYPVSRVKFYCKAAKELGVNLVVIYHGCIISTLYKNEDGKNITDAEIEYEKIKKENLIAEN